MLSYPGGGVPTQSSRCLRPGHGLAHATLPRTIRSSARRQRSGLTGRPQNREPEPFHTASCRDWSARVIQPTFEPPRPGAGNRLLLCSPAP